MRCDNPGPVGGSASCGVGHCRISEGQCQGPVDCSACPWNRACAPGDICLDDGFREGQQWSCNATSWITNASPVSCVNGNIIIDYHNDDPANLSPGTAITIHDVTSSSNLNNSNRVCRWESQPSGSGQALWNSRSCGTAWGSGEATWKTAWIGLDENIHFESGKVDRAPYNVQLNNFNAFGGESCNYLVSCAGVAPGTTQPVAKLNTACETGGTSGYRVDPSVTYTCTGDSFRVNYRVNKINAGAPQLRMDVEARYYQNSFSEVGKNPVFFCRVNPTESCSFTNSAGTSGTTPCICRLSTGNFINASTDVVFFGDDNPNTSYDRGTYRYLGQIGRKYRVTINSQSGACGTTYYSEVVTCSASAGVISNFDIARCDVPANRAELKGFACDQSNTSRDVGVMVCMDSPCTSGGFQVGTTVANRDRRTDPDYQNGGVGASVPYDPAVEGNLINSPTWCNGKVNGRIGWMLDVSGNTNLRDGSDHFIYAHALDSAGNPSSTYSRYYYPSDINTKPNGSYPFQRPSAFPVPASVPPDNSNPIYWNTTPYLYSCASSIGTISGVAYQDNNRNGAQDVGEPNLAGVNITLNGGSPQNTNVGGAYNYPGLSGVYSVRANPAGAYAGWIVTTTNPRNGIVVPPSTTINFGLVNPNPIGWLEGSSCTVIGGWTCDESDYSQSLDVHFYRDGPAGAGGTFFGATNSNISRADMAGVCGGFTNHVYSFTLNPADPLHAPLFNGSPHTIYAHAINIPPGNNPALLGSGQPAPVGTITCSLSAVSGNLYWDRNNNGTLDAAEIVGSNSYDDSNAAGRVTTTVTRGASVYSAQSTLPPAPSYSITGIPPNTGYTFSVTTPAGYRPTVFQPPAAFDINSSVTKHIAVRGYQISGKVCIDDNLSGTCDGGEALYVGSTTLSVPAAGGLGARSTTTNSDSPPVGSNYILRNFRGSGATYNVSLALPPGYILTGSQTNPRAVTINAADASTVDFAIAQLFNVSGTIYEDTNFDLCSTPGFTPIATPVQVGLARGGVSVAGSPQTTVGGNYSYSSQVTNLAYTVTVSGLPAGYNPVANRVNSVAFTPGTTASFPLPQPLLPPPGPDADVDVCVSNINPWWQTSSGDVRFASPETNNVPPGTGTNKASEAVPPSLFFSSTGTFTIPTGRVSSTGWKVNNENAYNAPSNTLGRLSYNYFTDLAQRRGITIVPPASGPVQCDTDDINAGNCDLNGINGFVNNGSTVVFRLTGGLSTYNLQGFTLNSGRKFILLVDGSVNIEGEITIQTGSVFILAASGNINIDESIGTSTFNSSTTHLEGIFTAQGSINIQGDNCTPFGTPDNRLNVGGSLIANAASPFAAGASGSLQLGRSLCPANDRFYPALKVYDRFDFLINFPDELKGKTTQWQEVQP